jgi:hypothetical protein
MAAFKRRYQDVMDVGNARLSYGERPSYGQLPVDPR